MRHIIHICFIYKEEKDINGFIGRDIHYIHTYRYYDSLYLDEPQQQKMNVLTCRSSSAIMRVLLQLLV